MNNKEVILKNISDNKEENLELSESFEMMLEDYDFLTSLNDYEQAKFINEASDDEIEYANYLLSENFSSFLVLCEEFCSYDQDKQMSLLTEALNLNCEILTEARPYDLINTTKHVSGGKGAERTSALNRLRDTFNHDAQKAFAQSIPPEAAANPSLWQKISLGLTNFATKSKEAIGTALNKAKDFAVAALPAAKIALPTAAALGSAIAIGAKIGRVSSARKRYARYLANQKQNQINILKGKGKNMSKEDISLTKNLEKDVRKLNEYGKKKGLFHKHKEKKELRKKLLAGEYDDFKDSDGKIKNLDGYDVDLSNKNYYKNNKKELKHRIEREMKRRNEESKEGKKMAKEAISDLKDENQINSTTNDKQINKYLDDKHFKESFAYLDILNNLNENINFDF